MSDDIRDLLKDSPLAQTISDTGRMMGNAQPYQPGLSRTVGDVKGKRRPRSVMGLVIDEIVQDALRRHKDKQTKDKEATDAHP